MEIIMILFTVRNIIILYIYRKIDYILYNGSETDIKRRSNI